MGVTIGIDLGTTNSCAAIVKDGKPRVISDTGGGFTVPSMVAIDEKGNRLVGQAAKRQSMINPANTIYGAKRLIGRRYDSNATHEVQKHFLYDVAQGNNDNVLIKMADEIYGLDEVSALILDKVRNIAQDILLEEVTGAVVTVPAYFNDRQRQAVKDAGKIAEIEVKRIINEPTAAALAYGYGKHLNERVAVFDLGGGTFDISLLEVRDSVYEVKATGGDTFLGGVDFDNRLFDYVLGSFNEKTGIDITKDRVALQRVKDACENAKIDLSAKNESRIQVPFIAMGDEGPVNLDMVVTREKFEELVSDLVEKTLEACKRVLSDAQWTADNVQEVLLVGGMTRMPYVQKKVGDFFGKQPSKNVHPDEAVAIGAAIMAYSLGDEADYKITLIDVLPMAIGVALANDKFHPIFPRNATIPNATSMIFTTSKENQTQLKLKIAQGDSAKASGNELLGEFVFNGIPPGPKGHHKLEVILKLSPEGMLTVEAQDPDTQKWIETTIAVQSGITQKTHKSKLIDHKPPQSKKEISQIGMRQPTPIPKGATPAPRNLTPPPRASTPAPHGTTPTPSKSVPRPPAARAVPKPPPARPAAPEKPAEPPKPKHVPPQKPASWQTSASASVGVQTIVGTTGKVLIKRDPITGAIIKEAQAEENKTAGAEQEQPKKEFKRIHAPPTPPSIGEKISGFFKNLFGKK